MFAVIATGGKQYNVSANTLIAFEKLEGNPGDTVEFTEVLALIDGTETTIGAPHVKGAVVKAEIVEQFRDAKIFVFKKKRRQNYRRRKGHRQYLTKVRIVEIIGEGGKSLAKASAEKTAKPKKAKAAKEEAAAA